MANIVLRVGGREFAGWTRARVTRGIEAISGSFELEVSERWANQNQPWQIGEEDECTIAIDGEVLITGFVDKRSLSYAPEDHRLSVSGRDRAGALVDCSAFLDKWEFRGVPLLTLAKRVCDPFGIEVSIAAGVTLPAPPAKFTVDPGATAFEVLEQACRLAAVLPVSDGQGNVVLMRPGSARATTALVEGENILSASADYDVSERFRTYLVLASHQGTDELSGAQAASIQAFAEDENVRRIERTLVIRPEGNATRAHAQKRAEWEATTRAAKSDAISVTVRGWTQGNGSLWPINALVGVRSPSIGVDGELLITQVTHSVGEGGTTSQITLRTPDAFRPEPVVTKARGTNLWKEIAGGV